MKTVHACGVSSNENGSSSCVGNAPPTVKPTRDKEPSDADGRGGVPTRKADRAGQGYGKRVASARWVGHRHVRGERVTAH